MADEDEAVQHRNAEQGDEAYGSGHGEVLAGQPERENASHEGKGDIDELPTVAHQVSKYFANLIARDAMCE